MSTEASDEPLQGGTIVRIRNSGFGLGKIVEYRGPLAPGRVRVYRVRVRGKPRPAYTEVREDQLEVVVGGARDSQNLLSMLRPRRER